MKLLYTLSEPIISRDIVDEKDALAFRAWIEAQGGYVVVQS